MNKEYREDLFLECTFTIQGEALPKKSSTQILYHRLPDWEPPLKAFTETLTMDHTTPSYNKEYSGSTLSDILDLQLHGYSDAAFADSVNRKLTSSYIYKLAGGLVLYKLNK